MKIIKQDLRFYVYDNKVYSIDWYKNEELHREDGPAEIWTDGIAYCLEGKCYSTKEYWKEVYENY